MKTVAVLLVLTLTFAASSTHASMPVAVRQLPRDDPWFIDEAGILFGCTGPWAENSALFEQLCTPEKVEERAAKAAADRTAATCEGLNITMIARKDVKSLSADEWENYVKAVGILRDDGTYATFVTDHTNHGMHSRRNRDAPTTPNDYFLIWHRRMLSEWDRALNKAVPGVVQPYYDWSKVSSDMFADSVWQPAGQFGGDGGGDGAGATLRD